MSMSSDPTIFIIQDKEHIAIGVTGTEITTALGGVPPKREHSIEKRDRCPRCENKTLIDIEKGGQICTVCGWPDKEDARERLKNKKKALIPKKE